MAAFTSSPAMALRMQSPVVPMTIFPRIRVPLLTVLLLSPLLLGAQDAGCGRGEDSANVNQSRIYTQYWLLYDAQTDTTYARATFRLSNALGTVLELKAPATVSFNGKPANFVAGWGWHEAQFAGKVTGSFSYTNSESVTSMTQMEAFPDIAIPEGLSKLAPGKAHTLQFGGPAVRAQERIEAVMTGPNKLDFSLVVQNTVGAKDVVVPADQTARFNDKGWLSMRRHLEKPTTQTQVGGTTTTSVHTKDVSIEWKAP
jgi:hypothetical protein